MGLLNIRSWSFKSHLEGIPPCQILRGTKTNQGWSSKKWVLKWLAQKLETKPTTKKSRKKRLAISRWRVALEEDTFKFPWHKATKPKFAEEFLRRNSRRIARFPVLPCIQMLINSCFLTFSALESSFAAIIRWVAKTWKAIRTETMFKGVKYNKLQENATILNKPTLFFCVITVLKPWVFTPNCHSIHAPGIPSLPGADLNKTWVG